MQRLCLTLFMLLLAACQSTRPPQPLERMNDVAFYALSLADTPYRYGGNKDGFDCSGFVQHVFLSTLGVKLPRTSAEMSRVGDPADQLQPGDLVFFNTGSQPYSHVGIYLGEQHFVHAPSSGKSIMVTNMFEPYWQSRYNGARRVTVP